MGAALKLHPGFKPGKSGNPGGRIPATKEQKRALSILRGKLSEDSAQLMVDLVERGLAVTKELRDSDRKGIGEMERDLLKLSMEAAKQVLQRSLGAEGEKVADAEPGRELFSIADRKAACLEALAAIEREEKGGAGG